MARGLVYRLHVKPETSGERGLPKRFVPAAYASREGMEGDFNVWRRLKKRENDLDYALLVTTDEMLKELSSEGWQLNPGDIGENITTRGIDYHSFAPGKKYRVGRSAVIQVSEACVPCTNLYLLPQIGNEKGPAFLKAILGRRGWYARVLEEGSVVVWDRFQEIE
jgi:hypothetical protein